MGLTVACVKWGDKYGPAYVTKLQSMCARHLPPHRFICFTERAVDGVECHRLLCDLPGWWQKIGLFRPNVFDGDVIYFDLDVVITGDLWGMAELLGTDRSRLWAPDDFSYSLVNPKHGIGASTKQLLGGDGTINSSVMMWHKSVCEEVWHRFTIDKMTVLHGDQNWITQCLWPRINLIPKRWISSYKYGGDGTVRVFHGNPKPPDVTDSWVRECWR